MRTIDIAPGKYQVSVTMEDIELGFPGDAGCCPIARAIKRTLGVDEIEVGGPVLSVGYMRGEMRDEDATNAFIEKFDAHEQVLPFETELWLDVREEYR